MGYGDARVRENPEGWKPLRAAANPPTLVGFLSPFLFAFIFSRFSSSNRSVSLLYLLRLVRISYPCPRFILVSHGSLPPTKSTPRKRWGAGWGGRRERGGRGEAGGRQATWKKRRMRRGRERAVDEHKHGILSDVDVYVNAEYLMGCQKQSL